MLNCITLTAEQGKQIDKAVIKYLFINMERGTAYMKGVRTAWKTHRVKYIMPSLLAGFALEDYAQAKVEKNAYMKDWLEGYASACLVILKSI